MGVKFVHLYVEKYDTNLHDMLIDFIVEDEFSFIAGFENSSSNNKSNRHFVPSMILVYCCTPKCNIHSGSFLTVNAEKLYMLYQEYAYRNQEDNTNRPATVFWEITNSQRFEALLENPTLCQIEDFVPERYIKYIEPNMNARKCHICLDESFKLHIWNVGQGNTNSIYDDSHLVLFDFGASLYYTKKRVMSIIESHDSLLKTPNICLILSHWDLDHYKLLSFVSDDFLRNLCCVFVPNMIIGLTAQRTYTRLNLNCTSAIITYPVYNVEEHNNDFQIICRCSRMTLYLFRGCDKNDSGFMLTAANKKSVAFLTADHTNYQVWHQLYSQENVGNRKLHVVVPHHGGYCGKTPVQQVINPGAAVFSVGSNNYGHPLPCVVQEYQLAGYNIKRTDRNDEDITIYM